MKKILLSVSIIAAVAAVVFGITTAFFSDTETSTGNTFTAGSLDLKVDSTCHYNGSVCSLANDAKYHWGGDVAKPECSCTWLEKDLTTGNVFFNFLDVKPGDSGEDTISLKAVNNDAYVCAYVQNLANKENGCTEPEAIVDTTCGVADPVGAGLGELQSNLYMTIWLDVSNQSLAVPCDNIHQPEELVLVNNVPIDSNNGVWSLGQLAGNVKTCLGLSWNVPGITGNIIQSDSVTGDIGFYVEQVRNNPNFTCAAWAAIPR